MPNLRAEFPKILGERCDIIVKDHNPQGVPGPYLSIHLPASFYEKPTSEQGSILVRAVEIALEDFWAHVAAHRDGRAG